MNSPSPCEETLPLDVAVASRGTSLRVRVNGEVDVSNAHRLRTALAAVDFGHADRVDLDLAGLAFCDTSGCRILLLFEREVRLSGHPIGVHDARPTIRKILGYLSDGGTPAIA
jgi:anti-anti-sigma factor